MEFADDVWVLILNQYELSELKTFLSVSKKLREIIISSPQLMRKIPVVFYGDTWREETVPFVEQRGDHVRSVKFQNCSQCQVSDISRILQLTPSLEYLEVEAFYADGSSEPETAELELETLKCIKIDSGEELAKALMTLLKNCRNIESFSLETSLYEPTSVFGDLLSMQDKLTDLSISLYGDSAMGCPAVFNQKFKERKDLKLKSLKIFCDLSNDESFSAFLLNQAESLEVLSIRGRHCDFHYYRLIFEHLKNLKKFGFGTDDIINETRAAEIEGYTLPNVVEFEADANVDDASVLASVLKMFPNLEVLSIAELNFPLHGILEKLPKLRKIISEDFKIEMMLFAKSSSLRELEIGDGDPVTMSFLWERLAEDCPNIERLVVKNIGNDKLPPTVDREIEIILNNLSNFKQLKYSEIFHNFIPPSCSADHDNPIVAPIADRNDKFWLEKNFDGTFTMSMSNYFTNSQSSAINKLRQIYSIREEFAIN